MAGKRVLVVMTSHDQLGDTGKQTGWYLPEVAHPYNVFKKEGVEMVFASPKGGAAPLDEGSIEATKDDEEAQSFCSDPVTQALYANTVALKDVDPSTFNAIFFAGGFGVMWDFPDDADVKRISEAIYNAGGIVSAVCHGPIALVNLNVPDGSFMINGIDVTGFTNEEEDAVGCRQTVPYTCQDKMTERGAKFADGGAWASHVCVSGRVITGQNPASAKATAEAVVKAIA